MTINWKSNKKLYNLIKKDIDHLIIKYKAAGFSEENIIREILEITNVNLFTLIS